MNLVIDIGNTQYKVCVFDNQELVFHAYVNDFSNAFFSKLKTDFPIKKAIYSDTRGVKKTDLLKVFADQIPVLELTQNTPLPITINYSTPETLGKDRIAGAVGASFLFSGLPCLIIDIGTALTIDFINEEATFEGGIISPGPEMRFKSLHEFTGKLPLVEAAEYTNLIGHSTQTAIQCGVQNGIVHEINEYISRFMEQYPQLKIILTGGYAFLFDKKINYAIFADSFLVPKGLNRILIYNELQN
ncbi:MAG: type III pantothenate kinase [Salinivirgaceae bacterium]|jgi:type III pantothenate kinase|nr:type III pantothenate kinase [Salinivirgaceae bacterium]